MYTPNNACVYAKAFSGCLAGLGGGGVYLDPRAGDESAYARMADTYAQEFDTTWGMPVPTSLEEDLIFAASFAVWRTRSPLESKVAFIPGAYNGIVRGAIALVQEGNAQVVSEGIDPNACGGLAPGVAPIALFVDPQNSTGFASDSNNGQTANNVPAGSGPILTTVEQNNRILAAKTISTSFTITYMSDDTSGTLLLLPSILNGATLTIQGTPQLLHTGGTLNAGTLAINPAAAGGGQHQTAHTTDIADWTPFISNFEFNGFGTAPHPTYLLDTSGGNAGTSAWIVSDGGGDAPQDITTADLSRPVTAAMGAGALTIGDSYKILRGSLLSVGGAAGIVGDSLYFFTPTGIVVFNDFAFTLSSVGVNGCTYNRCSFENEIGVGGIYNHCFMSSDIIEFGLPPSRIEVSAGALYTFGVGDWTAPIFFEGDTYVTGEYMLIGNAIGYANPFVLPGIGAGVCINRCSGGTGIQVSGGGSYDLGAHQTTGVDALIWGRDNRRGIVLGAGATILASVNTPPTVTGATSDFEFRDAGGNRTTLARAFDDTADVYTTQRNTTYANLVATIAGGGFGLAAHDVQSNAHLILA